jgi:hypothetical protein
MTRTIRPTLVIDGLRIPATLKFARGSHHGSGAAVNQPPVAPNDFSQLAHGDLNA